MMDKFTLLFQWSHDIDWFAKCGNVYIHAMSFGGLLPVNINNRSRNFYIMKRVYQVLPINDDLELIWNDRYLERRLRRPADSEEVYFQKRERYLIHFNEMARRGFYSFDRDLNNEQIYHLIVRPRINPLGSWYKGVLPEINERSLMWESETDCLMHIEINE